jgi:hypothetical protein
MKMTSLIVALLTAGTLTVFGQEGTVQDIKHDAKKAGEKIKEGVEIGGEKTKQAAETVGEKTNQGSRTAHRKSTNPVNKTKAEAGEERSSNREPTTPSPNPSGR